MSSAFGQALKSIRRSPYQAMAAGLILFLTFFIGYCLVFFMLGSHKLLQYFESRPQVTAFFKQTAPKEQLEKYQQDFKNDALVKDVRYISQDEALEIYKQQSGSDPTLLELVTADILPPSLEVSTYRLEDLAPVAEKLSTLEGIDEVVYQKDVVDSLRYWTQLLRQIGIGVLAVFLTTSLLVILVITSIRIASKKTEIRILRLMGATKWYIQLPFILEGVLYGMLGSLLAWAGVYITLLYATPTIQQFFGEVSLLPVPPEILAITLSGGVGAGILLGAVASVFSTRRLFRN
jgi:cell division transport system permease protein